MPAPSTSTTSATKFRTKQRSEDEKLKHKQRVGLLNLHSARLSESREAKRVMLTQTVEDGHDLESPISMDMLENYINGATYKASIDPEIYLMDAKKTEHDNEWRT